MASNHIPKRMRDIYNSYMASLAWKQLRGRMIADAYITDAVMEKDGLDYERGRYRCQECEWNFEKKELEVHHRHYDTLGCERSQDLAVVCKGCHIKLDRKRAKGGQQRSRAAYEEAGFQAWAEKVYGEDWGAYFEVSEVWEAFLEFQREQGEGY